MKLPTASGWSIQKQGINDHFMTLPIINKAQDSTQIQNPFKNRKNLEVCLRSVILDENEK
jgi:hypothetical protein